MQPIDVGQNLELAWKVPTSDMDASLVEFDHSVTVAINPFLTEIIYISPALFFSILAAVEIIRTYKTIFFIIIVL